MGMRFQKRIQILPWVWLNISKSGFSFSFGPPGLSVNKSKKGVRVTAGLPETGLSASHLIKGEPANEQENERALSDALASPDQTIADLERFFFPNADSVAGWKTTWILTATLPTLCTAERLLQP